MKQTHRKVTALGWQALSFLLIAAAVIALYAPFLDNSIVFDDHNLFTNLSIYDHAIRPFNLTPRNFPYFTLGFTEVIWKSIEVHRIISLLLHLINTFLLFRLLGTWLKEIGEAPPPNATLLAAAGSLFFAIHPVAVYGAGYLVQRTILFATLFSLLSLWFYWRSLARNRISDAITAALFYSLAIYSKEHAIMLPASALLLTLLHEAPWRKNLAKAAVFAGLCLPSAILVILTVKGVIGTSYEPDSATFINAIPVADSQIMQWLISGVTQTGLFFDYLKSWLFPDVRIMSADIRVDFSSSWTPIWITVKLGAFVAFAASGAFLVQRRGPLGIIGWGMLYFWLLFATELVSIRFQEPFVLYRSYIWAPGIIIALSGCLTLARLSTRAMICCSIIVLSISFFMSRDRLLSLKNDRSLWNDAAAKLTSPDLPGTERIFYNRGIQRLKENSPFDALADMNRVVSRLPSSFEGYSGRAKAHQNLGQHELALADLTTASTHTTTAAALGMLEYDQFVSFTALNRQQEAEIALTQAASHGHPTARALLDFEKNRRMKSSHWPSPSTEGAQLTKQGTLN
ncbi:glycosyltransferase family 39 protein [Dechloromonas denitrificans]|uniref:glycosyltransferase family 39 protein n=1 Tax=Dechloromonas denitrificans TaxID=281362 RepID=UPI001CF858C8|nr:glycosyltransferase family 39 protein [Dechloromonas denitrificans]UCV04494.1 glycosyltransferase family 39 protein [Dechloromonas denitrificans]